MRTSESPELSIVFVNYRSVLSLEKALFSIRNSDIRADRMESIVANNDVSEVEQVRKLSGRFSFEMITLPENRGFGGAANVATTKAKGKIIGFLNPDAELIGGSLETLLAFFRTRPEVGIVGGRLVSKSGSPEKWSVGKSITLFRLIRNKSVIFRVREYWESGHSVAVGWVSGGALFIRRNLFKELNGFDERFFLYFEDMDLCIRAGRSGFRVVSYPFLVFQHEGGASRDSDSSRKQAYYESQDRFFMKHRPCWEGALVRFFRSKFFIS